MCSFQLWLRSKKRMSLKFSWMRRNDWTWEVQTKQNILRKRQRELKGERLEREIIRIESEHNRMKVWSWTRAEKDGSTNGIGPWKTWDGTTAVRHDDRDGIVSDRTDFGRSFKPKLPSFNDRYQRRFRLVSLPFRTTCYSLLLEERRLVFVLGIIVDRQGSVCIPLIVVGRCWILR